MLDLTKVLVIYFEYASKTEKVSYSHNLKILHFLYQVGQTAIIAIHPPGFIPCVTEVKLTGDKFY